MNFWMTRGTDCFHGLFADPSGLPLSPTSQARDLNLRIQKYLVSLAVCPWPWISLVSPSIILCN